MFYCMSSFIMNMLEALVENLHFITEPCCSFSLHSVAKKVPSSNFHLCNLENLEFFLLTKKFNNCSLEGFNGQIVYANCIKNQLYEGCEAKFWNFPKVKVIITFSIMAYSNRLMRIENQRRTEGHFITGKIKKHSIF